MGKYLQNTIMLLKRKAIPPGIPGLFQCGRI